MRALVITMLGLFLILCCTSVENSSTIKESQKATRDLIITADDFGASANINEGISQAADMNLITCISVLANFSESFPQLHSIYSKHPEIELGVHLNITTGNPLSESTNIPSLVSDNGSFFTIEELLPRLKEISTTQLHLELRNQILHLKQNGFNIKFISDHNGVLTYYTPFYTEIIELSKEFNLAVRTPVLASTKYPHEFHESKMTSYAQKTVMKVAVHKPLHIAGLIKYLGTDESIQKLKKLDSLAIQHPDVLIENFWGQASASSYLYILKHLPPGNSEVVLHLGTNMRPEIYPSGIDTSYFKKREEELAAVKLAERNNWYKLLNISKINFSDLR